MIEKKVTFDVVKVYDCHQSAAQIQEDKNNLIIDAVVPSSNDSHKLLGLKRAKPKAKATCSLDKNQSIFITKESRERLFNKISELENDPQELAENYDGEVLKMYRFMFSPEILEDYCIGKIWLCDNAYKSISRMLEEEYIDWKNKPRNNFVF